MDIKWIDDGDGTLSAGVGSVILLVTPRDGGVWTAQIKIKYGIVDDATFACREDAVRWCGRRLPDIIDPIVATARTETALAERETCATEADVRHRAAALEMGNFCEDDPGYTRAESAACEYEDFARTIRARTTPATLSTETLAAIAEARGLRVVKARAEVIAFAEAMEAQLAKNEHKGGWKDDGALELHERIIEESEELHAELMKRRERPGHANNQALILSEAADVANFAMMVADVCGCLESRTKDGAL